MFFNKNQLSHVLNHSYFKYSLLFSSIVLTGAINHAAYASDKVSCALDTDNSEHVVCGLSTSSSDSEINLKTDILAAAKAVNDRVNESTELWLQAWGGSGDSGAHCNDGTGGSGGQGGYAQMITDISKFYDHAQQYTIYYYIGDEGVSYKDSNCSNNGDLTSSTGGASSIVSLVDKSSDLSYLLLDDILLISGGGGGGGLGISGYEGENAGAGAVAISSENNISSTKGEDAPSKGGLGGNSDGYGLGGDGADNGDGFYGVGGLGGAINGYNHSNEYTGWLNATANVLNFGQGGYDSNDSNSGGGGGGGYGGGGAGDWSSTNMYTYGGGGGGSYAGASHLSSSSAPNEKPENPNGGKGYVQITFNTASSAASCTKSTVDTNEYLVSCTLRSDSEDDYFVSKSILLEVANYQVSGEDAIDGDTPAWLSAYSGSGKGELIDVNADYTKTSMAGERGYAQTQLTLNDLPGDSLYYYIGNLGARTEDGAGVGGAATIVTSSELSSDNVLGSSNVILVAGAGGGAGRYGSIGDESTQNAYGGSGGAGGIAIATVDNAASAAGHDGYSLEGYEDYVGKGGNADGLGSGGTGALENSYAQGRDSWGGDGGYIKELYDGEYVNCELGTGAGWDNERPSLETGLAGNGGAGLMGDYSDSFTCTSMIAGGMVSWVAEAHGGSGGGGYGGGGGASNFTYSNKFYGGGGGGGGSYAMAATLSDDYAPTADDVTHVRGDGEVSITFHVTL